MMDDLRNHDARPTAEESRWMSADLARGCMRFLTLGAAALAIAIAAASLLAPPPTALPKVASTAPSAR